MNVGHFDFSNPLELYKNAAVLVCENPQRFLRYCNDFISQQNGEDGEFIIKDGQTTLSFKKSGRVLFDFLNLSLSDKKFVAGLYSQLELIKENDMQKQYLDLVSRIVSFVEELAIEAPIQIDYTADFDFGDLLKAIKVCPIEEKSSIEEKIIDYLDLSAKFLNTKFFVLVNVRTYLTDDGFLNILSHVGYSSYSVLFLERTQFSRVSDEKVLIIDEDLCEIVV